MRTTHADAALFQFAHEGDEVGGVADIGDAAANEFMWLVAENKANGWRDIEKGAFEGEYEHKVREELE